MKTTKKLLLALVTLLVLSSVTMAVVFANEPAKGSLNEAGKLMGNITSATTAADKVAAIEAFDAYMAEHSFNLTDPINELNYFIIVETVNAAKADFTEDNIALVKESASYQAMLGSDLNVQVAHLFELEAMIANYYFDRNGESFKAFAKECETLTAAAYAEYNARIAKNYNAPFGEYELAVVKRLDFEPDEKGTFTQLGMKTGPNMVYEYRLDGLGVLGSNGYYYEKTPERSNDPFATMSGFSAGSQVGIVFEFDYYHSPGAYLELSRGTCSINGTNSSTTQYGTFQNGSFYIGNSNFQSQANNAQLNGGKTSVASGMVDNAWNRIALVLVKETGTFYVYCNYQYLACYKWTAPGSPVEFSPNDIRFKYKCGSDAYGMRLDNMTLYYGTCPRILDRFEKMTTEERFIMSSEVIVDETQTFEDRESAYQWMQQNLASFYNGSDYAYGISDEAKAAVDAFLATDYVAMKILDHMKTIQESSDHEFRIERYDELAEYLNNLNYIKSQIGALGVEQVPNVDAIGAENTALIEAVAAFIAVKRDDIVNIFLTENLNGLKKLYDELLAIDSKTLTTISTRNAKLTEIDGYIRNTGETNILPGAEFDAIMLAVDAAYKKIDFDNAVQSLKDALTSFANAPTYDAQLKWADRIKGFIVLEDGTGVFDDMSLLTELATIKADYDSMSTKMEVTIRENNAQKIILCTDFYKEYVAKRLNETTPDLKAPWTKDSITTKMVLDFVIADYEAYLRGEITEAADWTYVRRYCVFAERARLEGYNESYAGLNMVLEYHNVVYAYYYELIQDEYLDVIREMIVKYGDAKSYVDKLGVCTYIENYIVKNAVNMERENALAVAESLAQIKAELTPGENEEMSQAEQEYLATLKANTTLFIEAVDGMIAAKNESYQALYDAWQTALEYYYFMEINSDEVKEAIAEYAVFERQLIDWQTNSDLFIETVNALKTEEASTKAGLYRILAKACAIKPLTNETYEGVSEALALYNAKYAEYMDVASKVNAEVEQTVTLALAEREIYTVLGVISKFFAKVFG